ncbi:MAG TPA: FUSC family protein [Mycobacterium sp.]|nr:FUSC family protein [Mycobacterium sp.]
MSEPAAAVQSSGRTPVQRPPVFANSAWRLTWSVPAAVRAVRGTIVVNGLFALTLYVIGDDQKQMCLFATFGALTTAVFTNFGGSRRDILRAHLGLAATAGLVLTIGTLVNGSVWLATAVTIPVAFTIFFAGMIGPNAAGATNSALLAYVLAVASPGTATTIPARLAGWWLAAAVSAAAILLVSPNDPGDRLRAAAAATATAVARYLRAALGGAATTAEMQESQAATETLMDTFAATPYRPTGLATADQAMANVVQILQWCSALTADTKGGLLDLSRAPATDREMLGIAADVLDDTAALLRGADIRPDLDRLERTRAARGAHRRDLPDDPDAVRTAATHAYQAQVIAVATRTAAADALIATRRADPDAIAAQRRSWYGQPDVGPPSPESWLVTLRDNLSVVFTYASFRSVWFLNAVRGSVALAVAVAVADLAGVEHRFWVILGTVSALRTNVAGTEATVWRSLAGTVAGFAVGGALLETTGTGPLALWIVLTFAVFIATYTPGTAPYPVGQAAFTIANVVAFNLMTSANSGWHVGAVRVEDVAMGCAISLFVGALLWPRGAGPLVGDNLADAFRSGSVYLIHAVDWALGLRPEQPDTAIAAVTASTRLDDALRGYLAEQGTKRLSKGDLWQLVMASTRLRLTAHSLAGLRGPAPPDCHSDEPHVRLRQRAAELADFYERLGSQVADVQPQFTAATRPTDHEPDGPTMEDPVAQENIAVTELLVATENLAIPETVGTADGVWTGRVQFLWFFLWVHEHLHNLQSQANMVDGPARRLAEIRRQPWWR